MDRRIGWKTILRTEQGWILLVHLGQLMTGSGGKSFSLHHLAGLGLGDCAG